MVFLSFAGMTLAADFSAPALLALLLLTQPRAAVCTLLGACLLHESAHFLAIALAGQKPELLRISAAGLRLTLKQPALCPLSALVCILTAGAAANLIAAAALRFAGRNAAADVQLLLGLFNLLPCRCTDGGALLEALLQHVLLTRRGSLIQPAVTAVSLLTAAALALLLLAARVRSITLWGMLLLLTVSSINRHGNL